VRIYLGTFSAVHSSFLTFYGGRTRIAYPFVIRSLAVYLRANLPPSGRISKSMPCRNYREAAVGLLIGIDGRTLGRPDMFDRQRCVYGVGANLGTIIRSLGVRVGAERGPHAANHPVPGFFFVTGSGVPFGISSAQLSLASIT